MAVAFNKFESFVEALAEKVHNLGSDALTIALTNAANAPVAGNSQLSNLTQIDYTNLSTRVLSQSGSAQSGGTYKLSITDLVLTAGVGGLAAFRYVVIYNDDAASDELVGWYDYGSEVTLAEGETFTINFDDSNGVLTLV